MEFLQTLGFAGFNSKMKKFQLERRKRRAIAVVSVATELYMSRQTSKQRAKGAMSQLRMKIFDISAKISPIYRITVSIDTISGIDNCLREKSAKIRKIGKISTIYRRYIDPKPIFRH